jgi:ubiquinone biosynthesis protein
MAATEPRLRCDAQRPIVQTYREAPTPLPGRGRRPAVTIRPAAGDGPLRAARVLWFLFRTVLMLVAHLLTHRFDTAPMRAKRARAFRKRIEDLGGLWNKAGQLIGLRRDIFPEEFCDELNQLQDVADGFDGAAVRACFLEELGEGPEDLFTHFDMTPIAAGSVGQVHTAITRRGMRVAVKVQRPNAQRIFHADLRYISGIVWVLTTFGWLAHGRWKDMLWELKQMMASELDYRYEAANIVRMRKTLRAHKVIAPRVFRKLTTRRILVMEYIEGAFMSDFIRAAVADPAMVAAWCDENDIDPSVAGWRLYQTHTRQVYEDNLFHSDLHPGNIVLLRGSQLALIDFGSIGSIDASKLRKYYLIFQAVAQRDFNKVADLFLLLGTPLPAVDIDEIKTEITRVMRDWETRCTVRELRYHEKSLSHAMNDIARVFHKYRVPVEWELMRVNRAELTLDLSLMYLMPNANYHQLIRRYEKKAKRRAFRQLCDYNPSDGVLQLAAAASALTEYVAENAQFDAEWVRTRARSFDAVLGGGAFATRTILALLSTATLAAVVVLVAALMARWRPWWLATKAAEVTNTVVPVLHEHSTAVWVAAIVALLYVWYVLRGTRRRIR